MAAYFNMTLYKRNLKRFWPLAVISLIAAFFIFIVPEFGSRSFHIPYTGQLDIMPQLAMYSSAFVPIISIITAISVFGYLHNPKASVFISALPVTRLNLYITNWLSGLSLMLIPVLLIGVLYGILLIGFPVPSGHYMIWLGIMIAVHIIFFSMAVFVTFLTGNPIMQAVFYFLINFIVIIFYGIGNFIASTMVFGYFSMRTIPIIVYILTPTSAIINNLSSLAINAPFTVNKLHAFLFWGIYLVFALIVAIFGYCLYRRRRIESAGEIILHKPVRSIMIYLIGFLFGAFLGYILTVIIYGNLNNFMFTIWMAVSVALLGSLGCLFARMFIYKRFQVLQSAWKGIILYITAIIALTLFIRLDVSGYERRVPNADDVAAVSFTTGLHYHPMNFNDEWEPSNAFLYGGNWSLSWQYIQHQQALGQPLMTDDIMKEIKLRTPDFFESREAIEAAVRMHKAIIGDKSILENTSWNTSRITYFLTYTMKDGSIITRQYVMPINEVPMPDSVVAMLELYNQPEAVNKRNRFLNFPDYALLDIAVPIYLGSGFDEQYGHRSFYGSAKLIPHEAHLPLLEALRQDAADGILGFTRQRDLSGSILYTVDNLSSIDMFNIELFYNHIAIGIPRAFEPDEVFDDFGNVIVSCLKINIIVHEGCVNTMQVLRDFEIIQ